MASSNTQQPHRYALAQYLNSHKHGKNGRENSGKRSDNPARLISTTRDPASRTRSSDERTRNQGKVKAETKLPNILSKHSHRKGKATIESLPNEILSTIFWKLNVGDLISASQVNKKWNQVAKDNLLWQRYYRQFVGPLSKEKEAAVPLNQLDPDCWKKLCLRRCKGKRDIVYLKKWNKADSYTGLRQRPQLTLSKVGVTFELGFSDKDGLNHRVEHNDVYWMNMSTTLRWYALVFPDVKDIKSIKVYACCPLMFYTPTKPAKDGINQRSLLMEINGDLKENLRKSTPIASDAHINLYEISKGLLLATYQADGEIAFVTASLHHHNLISRCLCGTVNRCWAPEDKEVTEDDIDPQYGLHGYSCVIVVRNMRQKLLETKFPYLDTTKDALADGYAIFNPVKKDDKMSHVECIKSIIFPWKTTLFKGIIQDVGILDITMIDERKEPFWTVSSAIQVVQSAQTNQFDFDPGSYRSIYYEDDIGKLHLEIGKVDGGSDYYLCHVGISLSVKAINKAFKTSY